MSSIEYERIINLTPHVIHLYENKAFIDASIDKPIATFKPSGTVARVKSETIQLGKIFVNGKAIPEVVTIHGFVVNMPDPKPHVLYLVSFLVAQRLSGRSDIVCGNNFIYNKQGRKIGCRSFGRMP